MVRRGDLLTMQVTHMQALAMLPCFNSGRPWNFNFLYTIMGTFYLFAIAPLLMLGGNLLTMWVTHNMQASTMLACFNNAPPPNLGSGQPTTPLVCSIDTSAYCKVFFFVYFHFTMMVRGEPLTMQVTHMQAPALLPCINNACPRNLGSGPK